MDLHSPRLFNVRHWVVYILFTFLCGAVVGAVTVSFLQIMRFLINVLWVRIPESFFCVQIGDIELNLYYVIIGVIGGVLIGLWQRKHGDYPILLDGVIKMYRRDKNVPYDNVDVVFVAAIMPLVFGGSVGPEAGLAGIVTMLFCWVRDQYKTSIVCILENKAEQKETGLLHLMRTPVSTFIGAELTFGDQTYNIAKKKRWAAYLSATTGGIIAFRLVSGLLAQGGIEIAKFPGFSYTVKDLTWFVPIVILGIVVGLFFLYSKRISMYVYKPLENRQVLRGVITGLVLSVSGMFLPYTLFAGEEQMIDVVNHWESWSIPMLFATGFVKILLINICVYGGWKGGSFFPCLFCATVIGYGLSAFITANQSFIILTFMASFTAMSLGQPLIIVTLCMLFAPVKMLVPIILAAYIGGWFNKKLEGKILRTE